MKTLICILAIVSFSILSKAQSDTLFTKKQQKLVCKIVEVNEFDFKYKLAGMEDGPTYVISRDKVTRYSLANGFSEVVLPDELLVDGEHNEILANRSVIKINPFCIANNQISFAFEKVIRVGMNWDVEFGYINNSMNQHPLLGNPQFYTNYTNYGADPAFYSGAYIKPGVKFFLGRDFSSKGLKYAHPLKGRYVRLDLAISYLNFKDVAQYAGGPYWQPQFIYTNISAVSFGGFVNYGRQFILANMFTLEYYIGIGYSGLTYSYSNPNYDANNYMYSDGASRLSNFHGFQRIPLSGLSGTLGLRLGYILPSKCNKSKKQEAMK